MKKTLFLIWALVGISLPATSQQDLKIGYVNLERVMMESTAIKKLVDTVQDTIKTQQEELTAKLTRYKVLSESYEQQKTILTDDQRETRKKELDELKISIEDMQDKINRMIRRSERELVEPTLEKVEEAIQTLGKDQGFDLILRNDSVLYASERCDITSLVIRRIDSPDEATPVPEQTAIVISQPTPEITPTPIPSPTPSPTTTPSSGIVF